jgi:hypothetical protein
LIYTDGTHKLSEALNRGIDKATALGAIQEDERERKDRDKAIQDRPAPQQQPLPFDHDIEQSPTHPEPAQTQAAILPTEIPIEISRARYEPAISTEPPPSLQEALDRGLNHAATFDATQGLEHEVKKDRDKLSHDSLASQQQQQAPLNHGVEQSPAHAEPAKTQAAELAIESPEIELGALLL